MYSMRFFVVFNTTIDEKVVQLEERRHEKASYRKFCDVSQ